MSLEAGQLINDSVRLVRLLGRGGMGSVWLARHEALALDVAVKFIAPELLKSDSSLVLARFRREAQLAAKLDNAHTVRVLDHGVTDEGSPYIVMELLRGKSVAERLASDKRIPVEEAVQIVRDVADGLEHAHEIGVVHRDIKPPNIFLATGTGDRKTTKILDFGIAKAQGGSEPAGAGTNSGVLIGTPHYMSPEQLMFAGPPDKSADVWALAVVAYEMLLGKPPFAGETLAATLVAITKADLRAPTKVLPTLSPALDRFFARALSIEPSHRFPTASALAEAFAQAAAGTAPSDLPTIVTKPATSDDATLPTGEFLRRRTPGGTPEPESSTEPIAFAPTIAAKSEKADTMADTPLSTSSGVKKLGGSPRRALVGAGLLVAASIAGISGWRALAGSPATTAEPSSATPASTSAPPPTSSEAPSPVRVTPTSQPSTDVSAVVVSTAKKLGPLPRTTIAQGRAPISNIFVPGFDVAREEGDGGADFVTAMRACERKKMALCTEAQWQRACEAVPAIGTSSSWTLTPDERGVAVRGGEAGCVSRSVVSVDKRDPERIGVCCTRVIATTSPSNSSEAFLMTTSNKLLTIEKLTNSANGSGLAELAAPKTNAFGTMVDHADLAQTVGWMGRQASFYYDTCEVAIKDVGVLRGWTADCVGVLVEKKGDCKRTYRLVSFADGGLLDELRQPKVASPLTSDGR